MESIEIYLKINSKINKIKIDKTKNINYYDFIDILKNNLNIQNIDSLLISVNNKLLTKHNFKSILQTNTIFDINYKIKGGILSMDDIIKLALSPIGGLIKNILDPIVGPLVDIIDAILTMGELLGEIIKLFINLVQVAITIFNPDKMIDDVMSGVIDGVNSVMIAMMEKLDFSQTEKDKDDGGGIFGVTEKKQAVCMSPSFVNLLILVLCPPLALFLYKGWRGFFLILICALMTYYLYYFPGFIFAALHILC